MCLFSSSNDALRATSTPVHTDALLGSGLVFLYAQLLPVLLNNSVQGLACSKCSVTLRQTGASIMKD